MSHKQKFLRAIVFTSPDTPVLNCLPNLQTEMINAVDLNAHMY